MNIYYQQIRFLHIDLHSTPGRATVNSCTSFSSFCMPSGASAKIEKLSISPYVEPHVVELTTVFIPLVVSFLILADLQPVTNILIQSCNRASEHA